MNILDFTIEELEAVYHEKAAAYELAQQEYHGAAHNLNERKRLEALKAKLGDVSSDDIVKVIESITLSANSINSEENVQLR